jgi:hypothetical protein
LPTEIGSLSSLIGFRANLNFHTGTLPSEIGRLTSLVSLEIEGNELSQQLPTSLGNLGALGTKKHSMDQLLIMHETHLTVFQT